MHHTHFSFEKKLYHRWREGDNFFSNFKNSKLRWIKLPKVQSNVEKLSFVFQQDLYKKIFGGR